MFVRWIEPWPDIIRNHTLCPAGKAFTGQTIEFNQQTTRKCHFCAMGLLNILAVSHRQTSGLL